MSDKQATAIDCTKPGAVALITAYIDLLQQEKTLTPERDHAWGVYERYRNLITSLTKQRADITNAIAMLHGENIAWRNTALRKESYEVMIEWAAEQMTEKDTEDAANDQ